MFWSRSEKSTASLLYTSHPSANLVMSSKLTIYSEFWWTQGLIAA